MTRFLWFVAILFAASAAHAQQLSAAEVRELGPADAAKLTQGWLQNGNPMERAWAAYWVERDQQYQEVPELLDLLARYQEKRQMGSSRWDDDDSALESVLDALIQLRADVPGEEAEALYTHFPVQALVLLTRSSDDVQGALLKIFYDPQRAIDWLAAADLLAVNPPFGFAATLLKGISIHASIQVLSPGQRGVGSGMNGGCGGSSGYGRGGWPPVGGYDLSSRRSADSDLLADGENPVYVRRSADPEHDGSLFCGDLLLDMNVLRRDLVGQLLGFKKEDFGLQINPGLELTWTTAEAYTDRAVAFVQKQQDTLQQAVAGLESLGLAAAEADTSQPSLEVAILDVRREKTPLPELVFNDPSITVSYQASDSDLAQQADPHL